MMGGYSRQKPRPGKPLPRRHRDVKAFEQRRRRACVIIDAFGSTAKRQAGAEIPRLPHFPLGLEAWNAFAKIVQANKRADGSWH